MLVLRRKVGEKLYIGDHIVLMVTDVSGGGVGLGIEAPRDVPIYRRELLPPSHPLHPAHVPATPEADR